MPRYFFASLCRCASAPCGVMSTTFPFIDTMLYVLYVSTIESATLGSRFAFLTLADPSKVFIKTNSPSISAHTGVMWGEPSLDRVDMKTRFRPANSFGISSSEIAVTAFLICSVSFAESSGGKSVISTEKLLLLLIRTFMIILYDGGYKQGSVKLIRVLSCKDSLSFLVWHPQSCHY